MDEREKERMARNEAAYRELNAGMEDAQLSSKRSDGTMVFICECGDGGCARPVYATLSEYEAVRASPRRFLVRAGHEAPELERFVEETSRFTVVEKLEDTAHIVEDS